MYACDRLMTLDRLSSYWLRELRPIHWRIQLKAPVIAVGCNLDLRDDQQNSLEQMITPIIQTFREAETCIEFSALCQIQVIHYLNTQESATPLYHVKYVQLAHLRK